MSHIDSAISQIEALIDRKLDASDWLTVTQEMIDKFAETTLDNYWIHVDQARAKKESQFGGTIAHGLLVLSLISHFREQCFADFPGGATGMVYGFDNLRFISPVPVNSQLRAVFTVKNVLKKSNNEMFTESQFIIEVESNDIERNKVPALRGDLLGYVEFDSE